MLELLDFALEVFGEIVLSGLYRGLAGLLKAIHEVWA
jgi:hypothetical protein